MTVVSKTSCNNNNNAEKKPEPLHNLFLARLQHRKQCKRRVDVYLEASAGDAQTPARISDEQLATTCQLVGLDSVLGGKKSSARNGRIAARVEKAALLRAADDPVFDGRLRASVLQMLADVLAADPALDAVWTLLQQQQQGEGAGRKSTDVRNAHAARVADWLATHTAHVHFSTESVLVAWPLQSAAPSLVRLLKSNAIKIEKGDDEPNTVQLSWSRRPDFHRPLVSFHIQDGYVDLERSTFTVSSVSAFVSFARVRHLNNNNGNDDDDDESVIGGRRRVPLPADLPTTGLAVFATNSKKSAVMLSSRQERIAELRRTLDASLQKASNPSSSPAPQQPRLLHVLRCTDEETIIEMVEADHYANLKRAPQLTSVASSSSSMASPSLSARRRAISASATAPLAVIVGPALGPMGDARSAVTPPMSGGKPDQDAIASSPAESVDSGVGGLSPLVSPSGGNGSQEQKTTLPQRHSPIYQYSEDWPLRVSMRGRSSSESASSVSGFLAAESGGSGDSDAHSSQGGYRLKGILKYPSRRSLLTRSISECAQHADERFAISSILASPLFECDGDGEDEDEEDAEDGEVRPMVLRQKRVSFSETIASTRLFRPGTSILGQKTKNAKKQQKKERRRSSGGSNSESEKTDELTGASESECTPPPASILKKSIAKEMSSHSSTTDSEDEAFEADNGQYEEEEKARKPAEDNKSSGSGSKTKKKTRKAQQQQHLLVAMMTTG